MVLEHSKLLVVDDNPAAVQLLAKVFGDAGAEVLVARSGAEAIERAEREAPDLVVLDVMMPDKNGYEVCVELKRRRPDLPVLFLTALDDREHASIGRFVDADGYLAKPVSRRALLETTRHLLEPVPEHAPGG
ncbi:MAG: response regulator transcription factor [Planctomycetota bacterium]